MNDETIGHDHANVFMAGSGATPGVLHAGLLM
jgi:hypothetical protein